MDKDGDEMVSLEEFEAAGIEALPNFDDLGAHGHHYDVESGTFSNLLKYITHLHDIAHRQSSSSTTKVVSLPNLLVA